MTLTPLHERIPLPANGNYLIAGDWHGHQSEADMVLTLAVKSSIDTIIHVGDFGTYKKHQGFLDTTQRILAAHNIRIYFLDGNHEDFDYLYSIPLLSNGLRAVRDNIFHIPRGFRWSWEGVSFMGLGGAASINVEKLKKEGTWWEQEALTDEDILNASLPGKVDVMFTHDSPVTASNSIANSADEQSAVLERFGPRSVRYCIEHRNRLAQVTNIVTPKILYHGHYHRSMSGAYVHMDDRASTGYFYGLNQGGRPDNVIQTSLELTRDRMRKLHSKY